MVPNTIFYLFTKWYEKKCHSDFPTKEECFSIYSFNSIPSYLPSLRLLLKHEIWSLIILILINWLCGWHRLLWYLISPQTTINSKRSQDGKNWWWCWWWSTYEPCSVISSCSQYCCFLRFCARGEWKTDAFEVPGEESLSVTSDVCRTRRKSVSVKKIEATVNNLQIAIVRLSMANINIRNNTLLCEYMGK